MRITIKFWCVSIYGETKLANIPQHEVPTTVDRYTKEEFYKNLDNNGLIVYDLTGISISNCLKSRFGGSIELVDDDFFRVSQTIGHRQSLKYIGCKNCTVESVETIQ